MDELSFMLTECLFCVAAVVVGSVIICGQHMSDAVGCRVSVKVSVERDLGDESRQAFCNSYSLE